ncbi:MAG: hypothetical protein CBC42_04910 [Betaproteobacteria bacterium TMED82]|nr:MAG: hypothetical protein CBC42_04910 [Betaproteobacteria bacterium TMED82]|tara:strand:- start:40992 stop:41912 length:921 start_codon:yes stop_codon:yes gene_type:complete
MQGESGRKFASVGLVIDNFDVILIVDKSSNFEIYDSLISSDTKVYIEQLVFTFCAYHDIKTSISIRVVQIPPRHSGFGSGTQLALAIGKAISEIYKVKCSVRKIAEILGRGKRSGIGIAGFNYGGFLIDAGKNNEKTDPPPLIARAEFPKEWPLLLILKKDVTGLHGEKEKFALQHLICDSSVSVDQVCRKVFLGVLPAILERDFESFSAGLNFIQDYMGELFYKSQGRSKFLSPEINNLLGWLKKNFLVSIGQSSWGPTGFAFFKDEVSLAKALTAANKKLVINETLELRVVKAKNSGFSQNWNQ